MAKLKEFLDAWEEISTHHKMVICAIVCCLLLTVAITLQSPILAPLIGLSGFGMLIYLTMLIALWLEQG